MSYFSNLHLDIQPFIDFFLIIEFHLETVSDTKIYKFVPYVYEIPEVKFTVQACADIAVTLQQNPNSLSKYV